MKDRDEAREDPLEKHALRLGKEKVKARKPCYFPSSHQPSMFLEENLRFELCLDLGRQKCATPNRGYFENDWSLQMPKERQRHSILRGPPPGRTIEGGGGPHLGWPRVACGTSKVKPSLALRLYYMYVNIYHWEQNVIHISFWQDATSFWGVGQRLSAGRD